MAGLAVFMVGITGALHVVAEDVVHEDNTAEDRIIIVIEAITTMEEDHIIILLIPTRCHHPRQPLSRASPTAAVAEGERPPHSMPGAF